MTTTKNTLVVTTPSDREIVMTRVFDAPRQLVFDTFTKPEHLDKWWNSKGSTLAVNELNLRVGGSFRFVMRMPNGSEFPFKGIYLEVVEPERLVHTEVFDVEPYSESESIVTVTLNEEDGKTTLLSRTLHQTKDARDMHLEGMDSGAGEAFDRLEQLLKELTSSPNRF